MTHPLYQDRIKALAAGFTGASLQAPSHQASLDNPLCGDRVSTDVRIEDGRVVGLAQRVQGCLLCKAAAATLAERAGGASAEELERTAVALESMFAVGDAPPAGWDAFLPVRAHRSRHGCVLLPLKTLLTALKAD